MAITTQEKVVLYLMKVKQLLVKEQYDFVPRKVNIGALTELGWTIEYFFLRIFNATVFVKLCKRSRN
ncbi:hypothetical protein [Syntrophomonas wolfei]|jgi:hypothetical protein|uniref:hypothetical protein n=1 Tax=Syntrophomonas wolfei TaxID=863 RepID=UPI0007735D64|nr:hypothetical protein [Syntrophomonas wolfei]